jgi:hypothetical protein
MGLQDIPPFPFGFWGQAAKSKFTDPSSLISALPRRAADGYFDFGPGHVIAPNLG